MSRPSITPPSRRLSSSLLALFVGCATGLPAAAQTAPAGPRFDADGTLHAPAFDLPLSNYLSPEARALMIERWASPPPPPGPDIAKVRAELDAFLRPQVEQAKARYPSTVTEARIGDVPVYDVTPQAGVAPRNTQRVLIHLHGGGFTNCEFSCSMIEAIPVAGAGRVRVVSVRYRQGPEHTFPAASEDVAAVYRALLRRYRPENIGIYGCSAGGALTAMSLAWFQKEKLPRPGAAAILCASAVDFGGDSAFVAAPLDGWPPTPVSDGDRQGRRGEVPPLAYFAGVKARDPLVQPGYFDDVLRKFPPTLLATGSRSFDASGAFETHRRLVRVGVPAELHVWDGLFHGFHGYVELPESREMIDVIVRFFDARLGRRAR